MKRVMLGLFLALVLLLAACKEEAPEKPAGSNESKFAIEFSESSSQESSVKAEESSKPESSRPEESSEASSEESSEESSSQPEESSEESSEEESSEEPEEDESSEPEEPEEESSENDGPTDAQMEAYQKADGLYHAVNGLSYESLIDALLDRDFDYSDAVWGVDRLVEEYSIDWAEEARWFAEYVTTFGPFSRSEIRAQLEDSLYTEGQIDYAMENADIEWTFEALEYARQIVEEVNISESVLSDRLEDMGFTHDEAGYAAAYCGADWVAMAVDVASDYVDGDTTYEELFDYLTQDPYYFYESIADQACQYYSLVSE